MGGSEGVGGKGQGAGLGVKGRVGGRGEGEKRRNVGKERRRGGGVLQKVFGGRFSLYRVRGVSFYWLVCCFMCDGRVCVFVRVRAGRGVTKGLRGSFVCHSYLVICFETRVVAELSFLKSLSHEDIIINFRIFLYSISLSWHY